MGEREEHTDTAISLHPLSFEEAIEALAHTKRADSEDEASDSTTVGAPESDTSEQQAARHQTSSDD